MVAVACASLSFNAAICSCSGVGDEFGAVVPVACASLPFNSAICSSSGVGDEFGSVIFGVARFAFLLALSDTVSVNSASSCASWLTSVHRSNYEPVFWCCAIS